ncbi:MAG: hypothetical protein M3Q08_06685 [Pseudomonadota bacterium]|nr:hypothetical protein [Pseudomonadota bacterium]
MRISWLLQNVDPQIAGAAARPASPALSPTLAFSQIQPVSDPLQEAYQVEVASFPRLPPLSAPTLYRNAFIVTPFGHEVDGRVLAPAGSG